jgi:hypothetical protein
MVGYLTFKSTGKLHETLKRERQNDYSKKLAKAKNNVKDNQYSENCSKDTLI